MPEEVKRISEQIEKIGKELYGEKFSIQDPKIHAMYRKVYDCFMDGFEEKSKGIILLGGIGVGKTAMMRVYQILLKDSVRRFKWVSGFDLRKMVEELTLSEISSYYGYNLQTDLYIDDIGMYTDVKRFGNTVNIISEIIIERYELFIKSGFRTHFSSNIALKDNTENNIPSIEKLYGNRVFDRVKEMCELVIFNGESLRK